MIVRVIAVENAQVQGLHSKFVRRRRHVETRLLPRLKGMGLDAAIFPAITPGVEPSIANNHYFREGQNVVLNNWRFRAGPTGDPGNFLSNLCLWHFCIEQNQPVLILEDDADIPDGSSETVLAGLCDFEQMPDDGGILYLQAESPFYRGLKDFKNITPLSNSLTRLNQTNDLSGTAAYCMKPVPARTLIARAERFGTLATDHFVHLAFMEGAIKVLLLKNFQSAFKLDDIWGAWNHQHDPTYNV